jgi:hypothetical protein
LDGQGESGFEKISHRYLIFSFARVLTPQKKESTNTCGEKKLFALKWSRAKDRSHLPFCFFALKWSRKLR